MKLRLGQPVYATDGPFGTLGDIIVDPYRRTVTHIVVQPEQPHYQARLVPTWLIHDQAGTLFVQLDTAHLRRLERSSASDYEILREPIELGEDWDVGNEDLMSIPYIDVHADSGWSDDRLDVTYDRMPKGEVEIRRTSAVVTVDDHAVGRVDGLVADDDHIVAVVVRVGLPGFKHDVLVPLASVGSVRNDCIRLLITRRQFHLLPRTNVLAAPDDCAGRGDEPRAHADGFTEKLAERRRAVVEHVKSRFN